MIRLDNKRLSSLRMLLEKSSTKASGKRNLDRSPSTSTYLLKLKRNSTCLKISEKTRWAGKQ